MLSKLATVTLVAVFSLSGPYQQNDAATLRREIEALKAQQAAMQQDLETIKMILLKMMPKPAEEALVNMTVPIAGEPARGAATAKVMLVEVSDYHCPYCRRHTQMTQPQIDATYINNGKVRYVFIDYPIEQLHPEAFKAHEAASCAHEQGKYWDMHAKLFASPTRDVGELVSQAQALGMDAGRFRSCLEGGKYTTPVRESVARMQQLGVDSTPTFLVGLTPPPGQPMKILKVVKGAQPFEQFKAAIDPLLQ
jgi:protein-disulfide isomerase